MKKVTISVLMVLLISSVAYAQAISCSNNSGCASDYFCAKDIGDCTGTGECILKPTACTLDYVPVCGCDGKTYTNECTASSKGISIAYEGACDADGDGIPDNDDWCPNSDLSPTIKIDNCDTGVNNYFFDYGSYGCTMNDQIARCAYIAKKHIQFVKCVSGFTTDWLKQGLITKKQKRLIDTCAQGAAIP